MSSTGNQLLHKGAINGTGDNTFEHFCFRNKANWLV
jgi:hypothetical protein